MEKKGKKMNKVEVTINQLLGAEITLINAMGRGNIPTNHAIDRNLTRVKAELKPFRNAQKDEPMCWHFWDMIHPQDPKEEKSTKKDDPTKEQRKLGAEEFEKYLNEKVSLEPYRLRVNRCSDRLGKLSKIREKLADDELDILNENFSLVLRDLDILTEGG